MNTTYAAEAKYRRVTARLLIRWSGLFSIMAGVLFIGIQLIHPSDDLSSVNTTLWVAVAGLTSVMALFYLVGIIGIYARQVYESGWLGLAGVVIFSLFWLASMTFSFIEAFVLPLLTTDSPQFVQGFLGIFGGMASEVSLGILPVLAPVAGVMYMLGGVLLGLAIYRANVLPRFTGALLILSSVVTLGASIIPHPLDRALAVPMGITFIWIGYVLWSERK